MGISGYLIKTSSVTELYEAIHKVFQGEMFFHKKILEILESKTEQKEDSYDGFVKKYKITPRELEILKQVAEGKNTEEIAEKVFLSVHTIQGYRKSLLKKLNVKNSAELIKFVYENKILT